MTASQRSAVNVVFGAMTFGKEGAPQVRVTDPNTASSILEVFQKHGHNEIDTARAYGIGSSEAMLGDLKWQDRGLVMATKYNPTAGRPVPEGWKNDERHTPEEIRKNLNDSLARLKTDKVDLYYLHQPDRTTPYEVTMKAMNDLQKEGLFRRFGISNYAAWEVAQICEMCKANGWVLPSVYQGVYNALHRSIEPELLECLRHYKIAFYAYNPLAGGYLTDRYQRSDQQVEQGARFSAESWQGKMYRARYWHEEYFDALDVIRPVAKKHGLTEAECALRWMNHHSKLKREYGDAIIIGASSVHHIEANMKDLDKGQLPEEVVKALDQAWEKVRGISLKYWH